MNIINNPFPISTNLYIISITKQNKLHDIDFLEYVIQQTPPLSMTFHNAIIKKLKLKILLFNTNVVNINKNYFLNVFFKLYV